MKNAINLIIGFASIITVLIISTTLTVEKFGSMWDYSMSKFQPTDHYSMLGEIWAENTLLCVFLVVLTIVGMVCMMKFIGRKR